MDAGEIGKCERKTGATKRVFMFFALPPLINLHFFSPPPRTALAEQDLAKVRAAVDALAEDAWMYEAPRHSSNE